MVAWPCVRVQLVDDRMRAAEEEEASLSNLVQCGTATTTALGPANCFLSSFNVWMLVFF